MDRTLPRPLTASADAGVDGEVPAHGRGDVGFDPCLAEVLLSVHLDIAGVDPGAAELANGPPAFPGAPARRRLASRGFSFCRSVDLRVLLGDVEFQFVSEMGLSHARRAVPAYFRDAVARLRGIRPVCAGAVRTQEPVSAAERRVTDLTTNGHQ